ncbi:MAG: DUF5131 family protein [Nitrospiraceae bacterium]|nr:DUF5131 family protein [Nitrospiraceae bacterium]
MMSKNTEWYDKVWTPEAGNEATFAIPLNREKPTRYLVRLFDGDAPDEFIDKVFAIMVRCPPHTFQVLAEWPKRMAEYFGPARLRLVQSQIGQVRGFPRLGYCLEDENWPLRNVMLGVSIEDQATADERIPHIAKLGAAGWRTMVSAEPLLGGILLPPAYLCRTVTGHPDFIGDAPGRECTHYRVPNINHLVVGAESSPGARPTHPDWVRSLRDQAVAAGVPFFFGGWGEWAPMEGSCAASPITIGFWTRDAAGDRQRAILFRSRSNGLSFVQGITTEPGAQHMVRVGKAKSGRILDGRTWDEVPEASQ